MKNAGWHYYRGYYKDVSKTELDHYVQQGSFQTSGLFDAASKTMLDLVFTQVDETNEIFIKHRHGFPLTTTYPGLIIGSGYAHQTGTQGEFKLGFFFDHTTGLPVIPGSSVKGVLRSAFPNQDKNTTLLNNKIKLIRALTGKPNLDVVALEEVLFAGKNKDGTYLPLHERDIFHDAYITSADKDNKIFFEDYVTPHAHPLKNPVPVRFMKIGPGVTFRFNFDLKDSGSMSASDKEKLFKEILTTFGIGAKTNTGYGQLS